jgi:hypothetical protein
VTSGLASARDHNAPYDVALLLLLDAEIARRSGADVDSEALQEAESLLQSLAVVPRSYGINRKPSTDEKT